MATAQAAADAGWLNLPTAHSQFLQVRVSEKMNTAENLLVGTAGEASAHDQEDAGEASAHDQEDAGEASVHEQDDKVEMGSPHNLLRKAQDIIVEIHEDGNGIGVLVKLVVLYENSGVPCVLEEQQPGSKGEFQSDNDNLYHQLPHDVIEKEQHAGGAAGVNSGIGIVRNMPKETDRQTNLTKYRLQSN